MDNCNSLFFINKVLTAHENLSFNQCSMINENAENGPNGHTPEESYVYFSSIR